MILVEIRCRVRSCRMLLGQVDEDPEETKDWENDKSTSGEQADEDPGGER